MVSSLLASSALLHPYLKCVHSAAPVYSSCVQLCARVQPYFAVWLVECLVAGLFEIAFPLPPLPLYILVVRGCYSLACLQSSQLILYTSFCRCRFCFVFFFSFLFFYGCHYYYFYCFYYFSLLYFDWLPLKVVQCDWCLCWCCLVLFCLSRCWDGAGGCVVDTVGNGGDSILQVLGCWPTVYCFGHLTSTKSCDEFC